MQRMDDDDGSVMERVVIVDDVTSLSASVMIRAEGDDVTSQSESVMERIQDDESS